MKLGRRSVSVGLLLAASAGYLGFRRYNSRSQQILRLLREEFGADIASDIETKAFAEAVSDFLETSGMDVPNPDEIVQVFLRRTNVIRALETKEAVVFLGLDQTVLEAPCQNTLSAGWL